ncbi:MAG: DUF726 domain-containing protein [Synechococcus sp.]
MSTLKALRSKLADQAYPNLSLRLESEDISTLKEKYALPRYTYRLSKNAIALAGCAAMLAASLAVKGEQRTYVLVAATTIGGAAIAYSAYRDRQQQFHIHLETNIALEEERKRRERLAVLRTLLWLANADNSISPEETKALQEIAERLEVEDFDLADEVENLPAELSDILSPIYSEGAKQFLIKELIHLCFVDGHYSAFERKAVFYIAKIMGEQAEFVLRMEADYAANHLNGDLIELDSDVEKAKTEQKTSEGFNWKKIGVIGGLGVVGGLALAATGGVAAPAIGGLIGSTFLGLNGAAAMSAGLAFIGGGSLAAGGLGMAGGTAVIYGSFGLAGAAAAANAGNNLLGDLKEFQFVPAHEDRDACHSIICIHGFMQQGLDVSQEWKAVANHYEHSCVLGLNWESKKLQELSNLITSLTVKQGAAQFAGFMGRHGLRAAGKKLALPAAVLSTFSAIDNPWSVAKNRAEKAGYVLGRILAEMKTPVSLLGYSLGARVIINALQYLQDNNIEGKVYDVWLLGGAVSRNHPFFQGKNLKKVVANNIMNAYSRKDCVLTYLYRSAELLDRPIGLEPLKHSDIVDVDVTESVGGHLQYPKNLDVFFK